MSTGERIQQLRMDKQYSRERLAILSGISEKFLYEIENDRKGFSAETLMKLSDALDVSMDYIMKGEKQRKCEDRFISMLERFNVENLDSVERLLKVAYELSIG